MRTPLSLAAAPFGRMSRVELMLNFDTAVYLQPDTVQQTSINVQLWIIPSRDHTANALDRMRIQRFSRGRGTNCKNLRAG